MKGVGGEGDDSGGGGHLGGFYKSWCKRAHRRAGSDLVRLASSGGHYLSALFQIHRRKIDKNR